MNKNFQLICSDVDGTLLNKERQLSAITKSTISKLSTHLPFVFISSRMPKAIAHLQASTQTSHFPIVAYNGGLIKNRDEVLFSNPISLQLTEQVIQLNSDIGVHLSLYNEDEWFVPEDDFWANREANNTQVTPEVLTNSAVLKHWRNYNKGAHKIMCMGEENKVEALYQLLKTSLGDQLHLYRSKPTYIEIAPKEISKLTAIKHLLAHSYNFSEDQVVAYGDNYNDIELLEGVGWGVAVENAKPEVKQIANEITRTSHDNGVALSIQELFKEFFGNQA